MNRGLIAHAIMFLLGVILIWETSVFLDLSPDALGIGCFIGIVITVVHQVLLDIEKIRCD